MPDSLETFSPPSVPRKRSIGARRAARRKKADREKRIIALLNAGVSVAEIASREDVTIKRMRALVQEILVRRMPQPPAEFLALQVSRLNEALLVSYSAMSRANLQAVDRAFQPHSASKLWVRSRNVLTRASAPPPPARIEANSSRRVARSLMVPLR